MKGSWLPTSKAPSNPYGWLILVLLLLLSAFFSAAEAALLSANKLRLRRLRDDGDRRARQLSRLLEEEPGRVLTALGVGNHIVNRGASILAAALFVQWLGPGRGPLLGGGAMTLALLIVGEST